MLAQEIRGAATYDDRIPFPADAIHDVLHQVHHAVGVEHLVAQRSTALVTSAPEDFSKTMQPTVHALVASLHCRRLHLRKTCDLFGEKVVPYLPAQATRELTGNLAGSAAKLALDGHNAKHGFLVYCHSPAGFRFFHQEHRGNH